MASQNQPTFLSANDCLTSDQKKVFFSVVDKDLHENLRELCSNTDVPSEDQRETYIEILQNFKQNSLNRIEKLKTKEKKALLSVLFCLKTRDAVGVPKTIQRIDQALSTAFALPEDVESEVSFSLLLLMLLLLLLFLLFDVKGSLSLPKRMNFRKSSKVPLKDGKNLQHKFLDWT